MKRILVVCTGNTCRSPLAAALLARGLQAAGRSDIVVESAGTGAWEGAPASEGSYLVALEHGLDLSSHRARMLDAGLVASADLILTMGRPHLGRVRELGGGGRAHLFGEFAGHGGHGAEVDDPYGGDLEDYRATLRTIGGMLPGVVARITGASAP
ncbi:MAG: low molecular weight protein arginine phosphatase [Gemmatimonadetes bacterium]|nr:low molecular weight protein arginine phosphatase [Gemmatimonadota bacterium]